MIKKYLRILSLTFTCYCLCVTTASARVCFLPDSEDCGQGEITNMTVTCESQGGYDTEDDCSKGKKTSQICYPNNDCYYRKCQYDSKADCEKHVNINRYKCLSETVDDTTCYYAVAKSCSEIDAKFKSSYDPETEEVDDIITDANGHKCYKTRKKYCNEINSNYRVACPSLGGKDTGRTGSDGACLMCYTCADKGYTEIGLKNLNCWDCEKCPIGLTFKCSVKKDLATSEYKIVSSIGSRLNPNAQICLKKNCADKFLKTEKSCASENRAFIPSTPAVRASDGVCGTCTLKTCKDQNLVAEADCDITANTFTKDESVAASDAPCGTCTLKTCKQQNLVAEADCDTTANTFTKDESVAASDAPCGTCTLKTCKDHSLVAKADCDTKTNTFTENKSVIARNAPCGTCTPKNTPKYDTYTIYAKVKCAGPYEEMDKCNEFSMSYDRSSFWGDPATNEVCPVLAFQGTGAYVLGQKYENGYVTTPSQCANISIYTKDNASTDFTQYNVDFNNNNENNILKNLGLSKDTLADDEELIKLTIKNVKKIGISGLKLYIAPINQGDHEVYNFSNYETLSSKRNGNNDYEYAFADNHNYISDVTFKWVNLALDAEKQNQYIGSLPTIYPVIRLKSGLAEQESSNYTYTDDTSHTYKTVVYPPYYKTEGLTNGKEKSFFERARTEWQTTTGSEVCDLAYFSFAGTSRNVLSEIYTAYPGEFAGISGRIGVIDLVKGDVFNYASYFPVCHSKTAYGKTNPAYDAQASYMKKHKDQNDRALPNGFKSGYVHKDGAIYIFEDGFDTASNYTELPKSECSTKTCADFGNYFTEEDKAFYENEDEPIYTNFQQVTVPCSNLKCYKADLDKCEGQTNGETGFPNYNLWESKGISLPTSDFWLFNTWVNSGENEESACKRLQRTLLESGDFDETDTFDKAILFPDSSDKKCAVCIYKM